MKTRLFKILSGLLIAFYISTLFLSGAALARSTPAKSEPKRGVNPQTGRLSFIGGGDPIFVAGVSDAKGLSMQDRAHGMANVYGREFGLKNPSQDLKPVKTQKDSNGKTIVRFQQMYRDVPVYAGEMLVNTNGEGELLSISGEVSPDLTISTKPEVTAQQARKVSLEEIASLYQVEARDLNASDPELWIFDESLLQASTRPAELVWRMEVRASDFTQPIRELVMINAQTGKLSFHFNQTDGSLAQQATCTATPLSGASYFDMAIDEAHGRIFGSDSSDTKLDVFTYTGINPPVFLTTICLGFHPKGIDISPDGNELAVALYDGGKLAFYDLTLPDDQLAAQTPQYLVPYVNPIYPNRPYDVIYGRMGRLYSSGGPGSSGLDTLHVIDTSSNPKVEISTPSPVIRSDPRLAMSANKNALFVLEPSGSPYKLYHFDVSTDTFTYIAQDPHGPLAGRTFVTVEDPSKLFTSAGQVWSTAGFGSRNVFSMMGNFSDKGNEIEYVKARNLLAVSNGFQVSLISTDEYQVMARFPLNGTAGVARALSDGSALFVSTTFGLQRLSLDPFPEPLPIPCSVGLPANSYYDMVIDEVHHKIFASDRAGLKVDVFSIDNLDKTPVFVESICTAGRQPLNLDLSPDGSEVAVAVYDGYKLAFIDTSTLAISYLQVFLPAYGYAMPSDLLYGRTGRLYVAAHDSDNTSYSGNIYAVDTINKTFITRSSAEFNSNLNFAHIAMSGDKLKLFYAQTGVSPSNVFRLDVSTDTLGTYEVTGPHGPVAVNTMLVLPDNSRVFTSKGQVWTYNLQTQLGNLGFIGTEIEYIASQNAVALTANTSAVNFYDANTYAYLGSHLTLGTAGVSRALADGSLLYISTSQGLQKLPLTGFPLPSPTPSPTLTRTPSRTPTIGPSPTLSPTPRPSSTSGPGPTRTPGPTSTAGPSPTAVPPSSTGNRLTYSAAGGSTLPGYYLCNQNQASCTNGADPDADAAHRYAADTFTFYNTHHKRNSFDNQGGTILSTVHFYVGYQNAFWNGIQVVYGDNMAADDVVGHEITHGVTEYSSNLIYYGQSGAINESFSDVWGEFIDQTNAAGNDSQSVKWLMGEDTVMGAIRSMSNPPAYGNPDRMSSPYFYTGSYDSGGVHINSGVNNKAAYLMVEGGAFNGRSIQPLGMDKTAAIYYEAQAHLLTAGANYNDLYFALLQACQNLTGGPDGITSIDCLQVQLAAEAVEMISVPVPTATPSPTFTPTFTLTPSTFTLVLQPDAAAGLDTYIYSGSKIANYGTSVELGVGEDNNTNNRVARSLIKFDLSTIPANATINFATLSLWTSSDQSSNNRTIDVYRLKVPFNEYQATWNIAATGSNWQAAGASGVNDRESTAIGSATILNNEVLKLEKQISLSPVAIQEMVAGTFVNRGFLLQADTEQNDRFNYQTSDSSTSTQRPRLVIQYSLASVIPSNTPTATPTITSPTPTANNTPTGTPTTGSTMSVRLLQPNGGEVLTVGNTYRITWASSPDIDTVTLGYKSCDSCLDWIANNIPNTGYYDWNVFVGNTTNTQFRIYIIAYDTGVGSVSDVSDNIFTVLPPASPTFTPMMTKTFTPTSPPSRTPTAIFTSTSTSRPTKTPRK